MLPNLLEATKHYWHQLNELEAAYQRGEVSTEEVDLRVSQLMAELGQERRATWAFLLHSWNHLWNEQRETIVGGAFFAILTYTWVVG